MRFRVQGVCLRVGFRPYSLELGVWALMKGVACRLYGSEGAGSSFLLEALAFAGRVYWALPGPSTLNPNSLVDADLNRCSQVTK